MFENTAATLVLSKCQHMSRPSCNVIRGYIYLIACFKYHTVPLRDSAPCSLPKDCSLSGISITHMTN